jgi:subfamily B ATP-binding cassette protein MsbA
MYELNTEVNYDPRNYRKGQAKTWATYRRLLRYIGRYKGRFFLSIVFSFLVAGSFVNLIAGMGKVATIVISSEEEAQKSVAKDVEHIQYVQTKLAFLGSLAPTDIDEWYQSWVASSRATPEGKWRVLLWASMAAITLSIIIGIARFLQEYLAGGIGANISVTLGEEMFESLIVLPNRFYDKNATGEIMARFTNDIFVVNRGLAAVLVKLLSEPIKIVAFVALAFWTDPMLTLVGICVLPPVVFAIIRIGRKVKKSVRRSLEKIASMAVVLNETFSGITIVKAYCTEALEIVRLKTEIRKLRRYLLQMLRADAAIGPITEFLLVSGFVVFVLLSARKVLDGDLTPGQLLGLYLALGMMLDPVRKLSTINNQIQTSVASADRVFEFIDMRPDVEEAPDAVKLGPIQQVLRFENVYFEYEPDRPVLGGVSFEIKKGEMVALVGFSGSGKSTIAKLIPRFYDVTSGSITLDGVDIRKATFKSLREQIGIVPQEIILFDRTVKENIAFAGDRYSEERIVQAAKAAHAHDFISALPQGYDTPIGESGALLSGGQRQRVAIARALVKDPAILILDEATSSLDSESEKAIQEAIEEFVVGRTTLVIAHRLSTVRRANRIVVMSEGLVVEQGTHQELMQKNGMYRRLYDVQFASQDQPASV